MSKGVLFWVLMLLWLIFGFVIWWPAAGAAGAWVYAPAGNHVLVWVLLFLIGWQVFGPPVR